MFAHKLKFILLPQLLATMHVHCLHWLMSTGLLYLSAFCRPCKSTTGEMTPKEDSKLAVGIRHGSHCQCTSAMKKQIGCKYPIFSVVLPEFQTTHLSSYSNPSNFWVTMHNYFAFKLTSHTQLLQPAFKIAILPFKVMV